MEQARFDDDDWNRNFEESQKAAEQKAADLELFKLAQRSVADYLDIGIDPESNLLGNRWLTREGSLFIVAPSGHGKSSLCIQAMICWAIGRVAFGIKPARPLRILLVESEDDDADIKAFVQVLRTMNLSQEEMELLHKNTRIEFRRDLTGNRFFEAIDQFLSQFPSDLLIINPLTGFCTLQLTDESAMADFLRARLNPLMVKHHCAPVIVAHMPKGQVASISEKEWYEWMYVLQGCTTLTNWARAILVFVPCPKLRGTYRFITAKRPAQSGWVEPEYYFAHSRKEVEVNHETLEIIEWLPASEAQIKQAAPEPETIKIKVTEEKIHQRMSPIEDYTRESFRTWCKEVFDIGRDMADTYRGSMVHKGLIEVFEGEGKGRAKPKFFRKVSR
jgi:hypothetical protein